MKKKALIEFVNHVEVWDPKTRKSLDKKIMEPKMIVYVHENSNGVYIMTTESVKLFTHEFELITQFKCPVYVDVFTRYTFKTNKHIVLQGQHSKELYWNFQTNTFKTELWCSPSSHYIEINGERAYYDVFPKNAKIIDGSGKCIYKHRWKSRRQNDKILTSPLPDGKLVIFAAGHLKIISLPPDSERAQVKNIRMKNKITKLVPMCDGRLLTYDDKTIMLWE